MLALRVRPCVCAAFTAPSLNRLFGPRKATIEQNYANQLSALDKLTASACQKHYGGSACDATTAGAAAKVAAANRRKRGTRTRSQPAVADGAADQQLLASMGQERWVLESWQSVGQVQGHAADHVASFASQLRSDVVKAKLAPLLASWRSDAKRLKLAGDKALAGMAGADCRVCDVYREYEEHYLGSTDAANAAAAAVAAATTRAGAMTTRSDNDGNTAVAVAANRGSGSSSGGSSSRVAVSDGWMAEAGYRVAVLALVHERARYRSAMRHVADEVHRMVEGRAFVIRASLQLVCQLQRQVWQACSVGQVPAADDLVLALQRLDPGTVTSYRYRVGRCHAMPCRAIP
jgi:hypothetical protein